ncbi:hypothetical protein CJF30_00001378 [Rutstroemia sp. NJR-2017a BBW]|nr:hypothetical protein CJF30_00001378 [Rutstroemia sp. NJR-2017a BBW]
MADDEMGSKAQDGIDREAARLWRCSRTVHEMVRDRGRRSLNFSAIPGADMIRKYADPPTPQNPHPDAPEIGAIWVEFLVNPESSIGVKHLRTFAHHLTHNNFKAGILISPVAPSGPALKIIPAVANETKLEVFVEQDLLVNITHHELVPTHILLSKEERQKLLQRYRLKDTQLPRIQVGDPVSRYLGLKRGQVVKIIRNSETAGRYASYRLCV